MIGNIPVWLSSSNSNTITCIVLLKSNSRPNRGIFVIMFMLGKATSNKGWVSFRARVINLFFLFRRKMNPKKVLTGAR